MNRINELSTSDLRSSMSYHLNRVAFSKEKYIIYRSNRALCAIISLEDLEKLVDKESI